MRGALIAVEGLDRAGKSTQHTLLCQYLERNGHRVKRMRFPDRTTAIGQSINAYLKGESQQEDHVIHLLFSANRWEAAASIGVAIEEGITVVIDRYYYSGIVYSAAKQNPTLSLQWARAPEIGLPQPDLCIFLDITTEAAAKRGGFGQEKYETTAMQVKVRDLFHELAHSPDGQVMRTIDAGKDINDVKTDIQEAVARVLESSDLNSDLRSIAPWNVAAHRS